MNDSTITTTIEDGTLVTVVGLKSEEGKKLNGGLGVTLGSLDTVGMRYPVRLYAVKERGDPKILVPPEERMIKPENLIVDPDPPTNKVFEEAAMYHVQRAMKKVATRKNALWWTGHMHKIHPDSYAYGIPHANLLREVAHKPDEAYAVIVQYLDAVPETDPFAPSYYSDFCVTFCRVKQRLGEALDFAMKIPARVSADMAKMKTNAISAVVKACEDIIHNDPYLENPEAAELNVRAALANLELEPNNISSIINVGAAYSLAGNNLEGARWYRRAFNSGRVSQQQMVRLKINLVRAQLQCPGMPLAEYLVVGESGNVLGCILKRDKHKVQITRTTNGDYGTSGMTVIEEGLSMIQYPAPSDPNDPKIFSTAFLAELNNSN